MDNPSKSSFEQVASSQKRSGAVRDLTRFLLANKKWWLIPILVVFLLFGALVMLSSTGAAPFIYTLF